MIRKFEKAGSGRWTLRGTVLGILLGLTLLPSLAGAQTIEDKYRMHQEWKNSLFNLSSSPKMVLQVNQYQCGLASTGDICTDVFDSPTGGGGFWPAGSPNQYMFNSGIQVTGIIPKSAGFAWAGDTVGAFMFDASGARKHASAITDIYNSLDASDLANWPAKGSIPDFPFLNAFVDDTALFASVLIGRQAASQQDSWVAYWDGDKIGGGRTHPMGIVVEQRTMAWNYPAGNEASIFIVLRFTNVTNNARFQAINEAKFGLQLPDAGWRFDSIYAAFDADPDVGSDPGNNYATAFLPFQMGSAYAAPFQDPGFVYPKNLFHPPFFEDAAGLVGMKYLKSPIDPVTGQEVGMTSFSLHTVNTAGGFIDPQSVQAGWRYVSLNVDAGKGDPNCSFPMDEVRLRRSCFLPQKQADVRMFVGSGPFSLGPGESATIAVMQFAAASVATPLIIPGGDNKPGIPSLAPGCTADQPIRPIDIAAGYIGPRAGKCPPAGEVISQFDIDVVPESLMAKALVAQAVFDNKFLLGFAPETPNFYLVPGNNQVTVVWEPSNTEKTGDPFFAAAGDPENPLYDPNYRQFDVEGYRVYRGTSPANMELVAQFDKTGSTFTDVLCMTDPTHITGTDCDPTHEVVLDIVSPFVQFQEIASLATGAPIAIRSDTALAGQIRAGTSKELTNTGIPFAYVDNEVRNGFQYFYKVTAFDINSVRSGPTSLESAGPPKSTRPRADIASISLNDEVTVKLFGGTVELNPAAPVPTIDAAKGTFSGKMPPTNGYEAVLAPFVPRLAQDFNAAIQIDSVIAYGEGQDGVCPTSSNFYYGCWAMYTTFTSGTKKEQNVTHGWSPVWAEGFGEPASNDYLIGKGIIPFSAEAAASFGIPAAAGGFTANLTGKFPEIIFSSAWEGQKNRRRGNIAGGSRWFSGANETVADPTTFIRVGHLDGVDSIWAPIHHTQQNAASTATMAASGTIQYFYGMSAQVARAGDIEVTWTGGKPTVKDVTHNVDVAFKPTIQASWGFLNADANANGVLDWNDFFYVRNAAGSLAGLGLVTADESKWVVLENAPVIKPVSFSGSSATSVAAGVVGNGFAMYINGQIFFFKMNSLPTDGTKWTLRSYQGEITASTGHNTADPSGYAFVSMLRPPMVPGLKVTYQGGAPVVNEAALDLKNVHTVPDPYYATSLYDLGPGTKELQFVGLPQKATIRIYSMSGVLVDILNHEDVTGGGTARWTLRNRSNQFVGSGVYFYHVSTPDGKERVGKFTVINSGFAR